MYYNNCLHIASKINYTHFKPCKFYLWHTCNLVHCYYSLSSCYYCLVDPPITLRPGYLVIAGAICVVSIVLHFRYHRTRHKTPRPSASTVQAHWVMPYRLFTIAVCNLIPAACNHVFECHTELNFLVYTILMPYMFTCGELVLLRQRRPFKLNNNAEGPFVFVRYNQDNRVTSTLQTADLKYMTVSTTNICPYKYLNKNY